MKSPFAGVGRRALATIIDGIPLSAIFVIIVMQFGKFDSITSSNGEYSSRSLFADLGGRGMLMLTLFAAFYYIGMELTFGGTIGKLMTGLRVRNADGSPLSVRGAVLRLLFLPIDATEIYLLAAMLFFTTGKNQRIGDLIGGTVVCYREFVPAPTPIIYSESTGWQTF